MTLAARIRKLEAARAADRDAVRAADIATMIDAQIDAELARTATDPVAYQAFSAALASGDLYARQASQAHAAQRVTTEPRKMTEAEIDLELASFDRMVRAVVASSFKTTEGTAP